MAEPGPQDAPVAGLRQTAPGAPGRGARPALECRICRAAYARQKGFQAVELALLKVPAGGSGWTWLAMRLHAEAHLVCAGCYEAYVRPAAELRRLPDYRGRTAKVVFIAGLPYLLCSWILILLAFAGVDGWIFLLVLGLLFYPCLLAGLVLRRAWHARLFGAQSRPLLEKIGLQDRHEVVSVQVKAAP